MLNLSSMNKTMLVDAWYKMYHSPKVTQKYTSMAIGGKNDGWYELFLQEGKLNFKIILEKCPPGYFLYLPSNNSEQYELTEAEGRKMLNEWQARREGSFASLDQLDTLLK